MGETLQDADKEKTTSRLMCNLSGRVLVVDDELPNRLYLRKLLEARTCEVFDASSAMEALDLAMKYQPDLILVDVIMPEIDGFQLCGMLRDEPRAADIPVIMVTAKSKIEDIETGFEQGAMDYIRKPFNPRELVLRVGNALALKKSNDALAIWNKRVSRDLELAGAIQRSMFSVVPHFSRRFEARIAYRTCMDVGGDAFDIVTLPDGKHCVYVADVSGHGVAPAMISALLKATASEMIRRYAEQGPAAICNALNVVIRRRIDNPAYFATLFMALHDPEKMEWRCMNCGHPNPLLIRGNGHMESGLLNKGGGAPIGFPFGDEKPYSVSDEVCFADEGDSFLLLYTDGLTEARHVLSGEECGDKITDVYRKMAKDPVVSDKAAEVLNAIEASGYQLDQDDCTAISIHMLDPLKVVVEQKVPRNIYLVSDIAKQSEAAVISKGISADTAAMLRLLVMELGANLVDHSGLGEEDSFWLQIRVDGKVCQLVLRDEGEEWNLETALNREIDEAYMGDRGRGLAITHSLVDRIERYRVNTENLTYCTIIDSEGE
ncbi:ATP-binding SpoIIE family protein phosphatase [Pontiella sulfatireligans]|uniref:Transcriptional regulatory protein SrrA n=1 Tax=Pontiella sulfatireligans TaxID=2750658 RepID=A0A6C2URI5_9BACT|nr:response regulator [Pontiella sulfatireligans]VGO22915.1 Transcriptional regulatory protein SrrA [Pontiella sulfatireligans]